MQKSLLKGSMQNRILLILMSSSVLFALVLGLVFYQNTYEAVRVMKDDELHTLAVQTADKIDRFIFERKADMRLLTAAGQLISDGSDPAAIHGYLERMLAAYQVYDLIAVVGEDGALLHSAGNTAILPALGPYGDSLSTEPLVSDFFTSAGGEHGLLVTAPLNGRGQAVIGVLKSSAIDSIVDAVRFGQTGRAYLSTADADEPAPRAGIRYGKALEPVPVTAAALLGPGADQWAVIVSQDAAEAYEVAYRSIEIYFVFVFMIAIIGFFLIAMVLTRRIAHPFNDLVRRVEDRFGGPSRTGGPSPSDEVGSLSASFDLLWDEINHLTHHLLIQSGETVLVDQTRSLVEQMRIDFANGVLAVSGDGRLVYSNQTADELLGTELTEFSGEKLQDIAVPGLTAFFQAAGAMLEAPEEDGEAVCTIQHRSYGPRELSFSLYKRWDYNGQKLGAIVVVRAHPEAHFSETIARAGRLSELGELSAGLAHEIRNPLAAIKGYAQMAQAEIDPLHPAAADLATVLSEADRLESLASRFLSFAKPDFPRKANYGLLQLIADVTGLMAQEAAARKVRIRLLPCEDVSLPFDYGQLRQLLINLIQNAVHASPEGAEVRLSVRLADGGEAAVLQVDDDGDGVPPEIRRNIFNPFFTTKAHGSGLGLAICSRIADNHGGRLTVSESDSGGGRFELLLPIPAED